MSRRENRNLIQQFHDAKSDYTAAKESRYIPRLHGVNPAGSGHSYHIRNEREFLKIIERARDLFRNDLIVGSALKRLTANVIQEGFNLDPQSNDKALDEDLKARWVDWAEDPDQCHSEGEFTFGTLERLTFMATLRDGDMLHLPLRDGSLQAVEAHRLRTPTNTSRDVVHGVLLDKRARRQEYWVTKEDLGLYESLKRVSDVQQYPARDAAGNRAVLHIYLADRFSQRRGISALAPVANVAGIHDDIQFATLVKQQMSSLIALFREQSPDAEPFIGPTPLGPISTTTTADGSIKEIEGLMAGLDVTGRPGEKLRGFSPNIPSPQYFEHVKMILTFLAVNLDLPLAVLLLDPSETNFSGWRGAIDQARIRFRELQKDLKQQFHQPVYRWKVRQWMARDPILRSAAERSDVDIFNHRWNPPNWAYIEPLKDSQADALQLAANLNSHRRLQAARGRDFGDLSKEIVEDTEMLAGLAMEAAKRLKEKHPEFEIDWRELLGAFSQQDRQTAMGLMLNNQGNGASQN